MFIYFKNTLISWMEIRCLVERYWFMCAKPELSLNWMPVRAPIVATWADRFLRYCWHGTVMSVSDLSDRTLDGLLDHLRD